MLTPTSSSTVSSPPKQPGRETLCSFYRPRNCKRLLETLTLNPEGSLGWTLQMLVTQSQREGAPTAGRGDATYRITTSMGTCLSVLACRDIRGNPQGRGSFGYCSCRRPALDPNPET